jgi:hypothetical protein
MSDMGSWKLTSKEATRCIVISSGVVAVEAKDPTQVADFSLRFWEVKELLESAPLSKEYHMEKTSYMGLIRCVAENKLDRLGEVFIEKRTISIEPDQKREWQLTPYTKVPKCGGDLLKHKYKSKAIDISLVMARDIEVTEGEEVNGQDD